MESDGDRGRLVMLVTEVVVSVIQWGQNDSSDEYNCTVKSSLYKSSEMSLTVELFPQRRGQPMYTHGRASDTPERAL